VLFALGGCSSQSWSSINPVNWWHGLEGGEIAKDRPPPPGVNQPPPNLSSVPPKPPEPDRAALQNIADALVADRANAQHLAAAAPMADPSSPTASPDLFSVGSVPPPGPPPPPGQAPAASATMPAASAPPAAAQPAPPPAPATPPAKAPVKQVQSDTLPEPAPPPAPLSVGSNLPPLPAAPPAPANVPGVPVARNPTLPAAAAPPPAPAPAAVPAVPAAPAPASTPAAEVPAPAPAPAPTPAAAATATPEKAPESTSMAVASASSGGEPVSSGNTIAVVFANGIATLPPSAAAPLRALAGRRGNALIAVTGYGDAPDTSPDAQAAALKLGLARAQTIAATLVADGVPSTAVQIDAQAMGRGGTARLVR
jgi:outer membrane protein OmpA-like peptidoglycan-associated protein